MVKSLKNPQFYCDTVSQEIYDSYNKFIYSKDRNLFAKLASKLFFCDLTKNIPGDVVELGVFKGSGMLAWLKANEVTSVNHKDVFGFDIFDQKISSSFIKINSLFWKYNSKLKYYMLY